MKFVVSFTTSPSRINKIKPMLDSIITQSKRPDLFLLNIPKVFPRTGETYTIPDFVSKDVTINVVDKDLGPATKIVPTVDYIKNNYADWDMSEVLIIYVDDDIKYRPEMINVLNFLYMVNKTPRVLCCSGVHFFAHNNQMRMAGMRNHNDKVSLVEGFASVCVPINIFEDDFVPYMNKYTTGEDMKKCLLSDDVLLSNYYSKKNIDMFVVNYPGKHSVSDLWNNNGILDYGNLQDALHLGASGLSGTNMQRYPDVLKILGKNMDLHIKVYSSEKYLDGNKLKQQFY